MHKRRPLFCLAIISASILPSAPASAVQMLPDRLLRCTLGRALNLDPTRDQRLDEIVYEGKYAFALALPAVPVRTTPPPDATEPAEPVHPGTRILADPAGLTRGVPSGFDRVIDLWPDRVELVRTIHAPLTNLIIVNQIDEARGTANLFMTQATDLATFDMKHIYQGTCRIERGRIASQAADTRGRTGR